MSIALCALWYDWDWAAAERAFRRALEIAPDDVAAHIWFSTMLALVGRGEEALRTIRRATDIDPLSASAAAQLGFVLYMQRRCDEAISACHKAIELDPHLPPPYGYGSFAYLAKGEFDRAIEMAEKGLSLTRHPHWLAHVGLMYAVAGRREHATRRISDLRDLAQRTYVSPGSFALIYGGMADLENWKATMQAYLEERGGLLAYLNAPWNDTVRDDPFFAELRRTVGLPEPKESRSG